MQMREVRIWLEYSEKNINAAKDLFYVNRHPKPYEIICFLSQQAAEMAVKAVLIQNGVDVELTEKTHDIGRLLDSLSLYVDDIGDELYDSADELFPYSVVTRYPTKIYDIQENETVLAIKNSEKLCEWSLNIIENDSMNYKKIYPQYDDVLPYLAGWRDSSIVEDKMPSISRKYENHILKLTVDFKDQELRSMENRKKKRYTLYLDSEKITQHNSLDKIKNIISKYE